MDQNPPDGTKPKSLLQTMRDEIVAREEANMLRSGVTFESVPGEPGLVRMVRPERQLYGQALLFAAASDLLAACQEQHKAIDILMAMLIETNTGFMPTKSVVWPAVVAGSAAILKATKGKS